MIDYGKAEAEFNGYELQSYSPGHSTTYIKRIGEDGAIYLTIWGNKTATLERIFGMVRCSIDSLPFPHPNFKMLENQILDAKKTLQELIYK